MKKFHFNPYKNESASPLQGSSPFGGEDLFVCNEVPSMCVQKKNKVSDSCSVPFGIRIDVYIARQEMRVEQIKCPGMSSRSYKVVKD